MSARAGRTVAEWTTFGICCGVVLAVVALLGAQLLGSDDPAAPAAAQKGPVRQEGAHFYVPVEVTNHGGLTASDVQVVAELTIDGQVSDGEQRIDFLAGGETEKVVFSFDRDPGRGEISVRVASYGVP